KGLQPPAGRESAESPMAHDKSKPRAEACAAEKWWSLPRFNSARSRRIDCAASAMLQVSESHGRFYNRPVARTAHQPLAFLPAFARLDTLPERFLGGSG